jgi:hypothetical protein
MARNGGARTAAQIPSERCSRQSLVSLLFDSTMILRRQMLMTDLFKDVEEIRKLADE